MNNVAKLKPDADAPADPLAKMREPFPDNQISKLPKETGKQRDQRLEDQKKGVWPKRCGVCGGLHHSNAVHLDYVGHAALTDRLLDVDPHWSWEPMALTAEGLPAFDRSGGLWIKLTICGVTRIGYGCADGKTGGDAVKEIIGDALRNGGMRFGAALDLWHKGVLHEPGSPGDDGDAPTDRPNTAVDMAINLLRGCADAAWFKDAWAKNYEGWKKVMSEDDYKRVLTVKTELVNKFIAEAEEAKRREAQQKPASAEASVDPFDDEIPF